MPEEPEDPQALKASKSPKTLRNSKASKVCKTPKVSTEFKACQTHAVPADVADPVEVALATAHATDASIAETLKVEIEAAKNDSNFYRELLNEQAADATREASTTIATINALQGDVDRYREIAKHYKDKATQQNVMIFQQLRIAHETSDVLAQVRADMTKVKGTVRIANDDVNAL
jgi:hypothetical protein